MLPQVSIVTSSDPFLYGLSISRVTFSIPFRNGRLERAYALDSDRVLAVGHIRDDNIDKLLLAIIDAASGTILTRASHEGKASHSSLCPDQSYLFVCVIGGIGRIDVNSLAVTNEFKFRHLLLPDGSWGDPSEYYDAKSECYRSAQHEAEYKQAQIVTMNIRQIRAEDAEHVVVHATASVYNITRAKKT